MAAPTVVSKSFNADTNILTVEFSEVVTPGTGWTAESFYLTDAAGRNFISADGVGTDSLNGSGTDTLQIQLAYASTGGHPASTWSISDDAVQNGATEGIVGISEQALYVHLKEVAEGLTWDDVTAYEAVITEVRGGTLDATAEPQQTNLQLAAVLTSLKKGPRTEDRAWALVDAHNKFNQSSKSPQDHAALAFAVGELQASLNARGTMLMKSNGE